jgi:hypothetical protein
MTDLVCYCFGYSISDIERDVAANGRSTLLERIASAKKTGGCDCAAKHPRGT